MPVTIMLPAGALTLAVRTALDEDLGAEGEAVEVAEVGCP